MFCIAKTMQYFFAVLDSIKTLEEIFTTTSTLYTVVGNLKALPVVTMQNLTYLYTMSMAALRLIISAFYVSNAIDPK